MDDKCIKDLMLRLKEGDGAALGEIMNGHEKSVLNTIYRFIGDRTRSEELAQEVFLRVYTHAKRYRPKAKFSTWLFRIVTNLCLNELRQRGRFKKVSLEEPISIGDEEVKREIADLNQVQADKLLEQKELNSIVNQAIASLPDRQRIALILHEHNGLSYKEITKVMRVSLSSVESLIHRAKVRLRERLTNYLEEK